MIDVIPGNASKDLGSWLDRQTSAWLGQVRVVATDLAESYRSGPDGRLDHATPVADPFHVVRLANRCLDQVRRRVQQPRGGHRGRKRDPLYWIRKLMLTGAGRLEGQGLSGCSLACGLATPTRRCSGLAGQGVGARRLPHRAPGRRRAAARQDDRGLPPRPCSRDPFARADPRPLADGDPEPPHDRRLERPHRGLNLLVKKVKRAGHGFRSFANYRLRILVHAGGVDWPATRPPAPHIRNRSPQ